jgi:uncharacterized protein
VRAERERCDVVLHAGDLVSPDVLDLLRAHAPVHAVLGNNDTALRGVLPERAEIALDGVPVALVHEPGPARGRPGRLRRWFPDARVVVFGHSHQPVLEWHEGQLLFNPGSPTERRRAPSRTYGLLEVAAGTVAHAAIVEC